MAIGIRSFDGLDGSRRSPTGSRFSNLSNMCNERVCCNLFRRERVERFLCASWRFPPSFLDLPFVSASLRFAATRSFPCWLASPGAAATSGAKRISFLFLGLVACCTVCCSSLACAAAPSCAKRISLLVLGVVACCTVRCNGCGCLHGACGAMHAAYALRFPAPVGQRRRLLAI